MKDTSNIIFQELWKIRYPHLKKVDKKLIEKVKKENLKRLKQKTPNIRTKISLPSKNIFFELTTARNRLLITEDEQSKLQKTVVGFLGLSVGSHAALTWMMESRADYIKISDPDTIDATNLNRLRLGWDDLGKLKTEVVKQQIYQINPFTEVITSNKTDSLVTITEMLRKNHPVHIVVDAIDDIYSKLVLRKICKKYRIPILSGADVGDNVMIDIERYDLDPNYPYFHNLLPNIESVDLNSLSPLEKNKLFAKLVSFDLCSEKMIKSMLSIGTYIPTWPQLGATATIAGGIFTTLIKKITLNETVKSGRYHIALDDIFVSDYQSSKRKNTRNRMRTVASKIYE